MGNEQKHRAVILLNIEVHPLNDDGACSGQSVSNQILKDSGVSRYTTVSVDGFDLDDCLRKLKEKISEFRA